MEWNSYLEVWVLIPENELKYRKSISVIFSDFNKIFITVKTNKYEFGWFYSHTYILFITN